MQEIKGLVKFDWLMFPTEPEMTSSDFLSITPQVTVLNASAAWLLLKGNRKKKEGRRE